MILFSKKHQATSSNTKFIMILDNNKIEQKSQVKHFGINFDQFLTLQVEVKNISRKMACGIKTLIKKRPLTIQNPLLQLNTLVISHFHYPAVPLSCKTTNLAETLK